MDLRQLTRLSGAFALCAVAAPAYSGTSGPQIVNWDTLSHGEIVTSQFAGMGLNVSAINPNRPHDLAIIFNSLLNGTADPDLEGPPWAGGNLAPDTVLGNLLIIAENDIDADGDGLIDDPDDEGNRPAGSLIFDFDFAINSFGLDIIDIEGPFEEFGSLEFFFGAALVETITFANFVSPASMYFDPTVQFGDNTANRIEPLSLSGGASFDRVVINMGGSGAVDNIVFQQIPAPASLPLLLGAAMIVHRRRRS